MAKQPKGMITRRAFETLVAGMQGSTGGRGNERLQVGGVTIMEEQSVPIPAYPAPFDISLADEDGTEGVWVFVPNSIDSTLHNLVRDAQELTVTKPPVGEGGTPETVQIGKNVQPYVSGTWYRSFGDQKGEDFLVKDKDDKNVSYSIFLIVDYTATKDGKACYAFVTAKGEVREQLKIQIDIPRFMRVYEIAILAFDDCAGLHYVLPMPLAGIVIPERLQTNSVDVGQGLVLTQVELDTSPDFIGCHRCKGERRFGNLLEPIAHNIDRRIVFGLMGADAETRALLDLLFNSTQSEAESVALKTYKETDGVDSNPVVAQKNADWLVLALLAECQGEKIIDNATFWIGVVSTLNADVRSPYEDISGYGYSAFNRAYIGYGKIDGLVGMAWSISSGFWSYRYKMPINMTLFQSFGKCMWINPLTGLGRVIEMNKNTVYFVQHRQSQESVRIERDIPDKALPTDIHYPYPIMLRDYDWIRGDWRGNATDIFVIPVDKPESGKEPEDPCENHPDGGISVVGKDDDEEGTVIVDGGGGAGGTDDGTAVTGCEFEVEDELPIL